MSAAAVKASAKGSAPKESPEEAEKRPKAQFLIEARAGLARVLGRGTSMAILGNISRQHLGYISTRLRESAEHAERYHREGLEDLGSLEAREAGHRRAKGGGAAQQRDRRHRGSTATPAGVKHCSRHAVETGSVAPKRSLVGVCSSRGQPGAVRSPRGAEADGGASGECTREHWRREAQAGLAARAWRRQCRRSESSERAECERGREH